MVKFKLVHLIFFVVFLGQITRIAVYKNINKIYLFKKKSSEQKKKKKFELNKMENTNI